MSGVPEGWQMIGDTVPRLPFRRWVEPVVYAKALHRLTGLPSVGGVISWIKASENLDVIVKNLTREGRKHRFGYEGVFIDAVLKVSEVAFVDSESFRDKWEYHADGQHWNEKIGWTDCAGMLRILIFDKGSSANAVMDTQERSLANELMSNRDISKFVPRLDLAGEFFGKDKRSFQYRKFHEQLIIRFDALFAECMDQDGLSSKLPDVEWLRKNGKFKARRFDTIWEQYTKIVARFVNGQGPTRSGSWTGTPTIRDRLVTVRNIGTVALQGVNELIQRIGDARINNPEAEVAIDELRALRDALTELINAAEQGRPIDQALSVVDKWRVKAVGNMRRYAEIYALGLPTAIGVTYLLEAIFSNDPVAFGVAGTLCAATMAPGFYGIAKKGD